MTDTRPQHPAGWRAARARAPAPAGSLAAGGPSTARSARGGRGDGAAALAAVARRLDFQASMLAAAGALGWLLLAPRTPDLAAQSYRVGLFERQGFVIWDNGWYAGHHVPGYSLLFPPLAAGLGMRVVGALAAVLAAFCFARLAESHFGAGARIGVLWFALATATDLLIGRLTYALGAALGLAALRSAQRGRRPGAAVLAALTAAATPLAGIFLGMAAGALFIAGRRRDALILALPALVVAGGLALVFPEGGRQPFGTQALAVSILLTLVFVALAGRERVLRIGAGLYLAGTLAAFVLVTPIGGNTTRLGAVLAGPLLLCARPELLRRRGGRGVWALTAGALAVASLVTWQWYAPVREVSRSIGDPLSRPASYRGLEAFLAAHHAEDGRIEVPFTRSHWEAAVLSPRYPLARGWEKQLDAGYNPLFFSRRLPPATYHAWLRRLGVRYVAVAMAPSDPSGRAEVGLVLGGLPYLRAVYGDSHWRVFGLADPQPLAGGPARLRALGLQSFSLRFRRGGTSLARVRFSPYWQASTGCVARAPGGFTEVSAPGPGVVRVSIAFSLGRILRPGPRCAARAAGPAAAGFSPLGSG